MAINTFPAVASPVKSVQRGSAGGSGNVTITAIDITKAMVNVFGTASSGTVSASFGMSMNAGSATLIGTRGFWGSQTYTAGSRPVGSTAVGATYQGSNGATAGAWTFPATVNAGNAVVNAGSNNLVSAVVQGFLANSTTLTVSGACRWEVVEFN
jgi:hypothetical protein